MGFLDSLFGPKDIASKCAKFAENGNYDKLIKFALEGKTMEIREAAFAAIATVKPDPDLIKCCMDALKEDDDAVRLAAAKALVNIGTKPNAEPLFHYSESDSNEEIKALLKQAAVNAKERTPRW